MSSAKPTYGNYELALGALCPALLARKSEPSPEDRTRHLAALEVALERVRGLQEESRSAPPKTAAVLRKHDGLLFFPRARISARDLNRDQTGGFSVAIPRLEQLGLETYAVKDGTVARGIQVRGRESILRLFDEIREISHLNQLEFERRYEEIFPFVTKKRVLGTCLGTSLSLALGTYFGVGLFEVITHPLFLKNGMSLGLITGGLVAIPSSFMSFYSGAAGLAYVHGLLDAKRRPFFERWVGTNSKGGYPRTFERIEKSVRSNAPFDSRGFIYHWHDLVLDRGDVEDLKAAAAEGRLPNDRFFREFDRPRLLERDDYDVDVAYRLALDHVLYQEDGELVLLMFDRFKRVEPPRRRPKPRDRKTEFRVESWMPGGLVPQR